jgi:hypothetical protein
LDQLFNLTETPGQIILEKPKKGMQKELDVSIEDQTPGL